MPKNEIQREELDERRLDLIGAWNQGKSADIILTKSILHGSIHELLDLSSDVQHGKEAGKKMVASYGGLIRSIAGKLSNSDFPFEELLQVGNHQMIESVGHYKNGSFTTYLYIRIRGAMIDFLRQTGHHGRLFLRKEIDTAIDEFMQENHREPTDKELAEKIDKSEVRVQDVRTKAARIFLSIEQIRDKEDEDDCDFMISEEKDMVQESDDLIYRVQILEAIDHSAKEIFSKRDQRILYLLLDEKDFMLKEIGKMEGLGEARVCIIRKKIIQRLQMKLGAQNFL